MKFLIVVAFVATIAAVHAAGLTEEQKAKAKQYLAECNVDNKITDDDIAKLKTGDYPNASEDVKCFANCFLEKAGILKDGVLQEAVVVEKLSPSIGDDKTKQILDICRGETGANKCETAFNLHNCFRKNKAVVE